MPTIYYNLEEIPEDIWDKKTVFLIGPKSRDSNILSYRQAFTTYLFNVEQETGLEFVIFNPEGPNWLEEKSSRCTKWELERLLESSVIVVALNHNPEKLPGLSSRTEIGLLLANRRNIILWQPTDSYKTGYICGRFKERPYLYMTDSLKEAARIVPHVWNKNMELIQVRSGNFNSMEIRPNGCDPFYFESAIRRVEMEHTNGAIYIYLPLFDTYGYGSIVQKLGGYSPFIQSRKYNIVYKWNSQIRNKIPEPGSSISAAFGMFFSPDESHCLLIYETKYGRSRWGFVGGAVDRNELDLEAFKREVEEEIGISLELNPNNTFITGGYNRKEARTYGVWDPEDPPVHMNDHFTVYLIHIPMTAKFTINGDETQKIKWFPVKDILEGNIPELNEYNQKMILDYLKNKRKLNCYQCSPTMIKFN